MADTDSYLKWAAATLRRLPGSWSCEVVLLRTELLPSPAQQRAALGTDHGVRSLGLAALMAEVRRQDPDVIMLAGTGPVVELLAALPVIAGRRRVLVSGLPGLALPVSARAVQARRRCDVLVAHSRRERAALLDQLRADDLDLEVALARLPFLAEDPGAGPHQEQSSATTDVIFAAQALVPPEPEQRQQILTALSRVSPPLRPVVKLRADAGERQTHDEDHPYPELWRQLVADDHREPAAITFSHEPMAAALREARGLVTVSSTAALEAMAAGVGVIVLEDFGVSTQMINTVFAGSGCLGTLADLRAGRFRQPDPDWMLENYFHPAAEDDLAAVIAARLPRQRGGSAPPRPRRAWRRVLVESVRLWLPVRVQRRLRRLWGRVGRR